MPEFATPFDAANAAAEELLSRCGVERFDLAVILGTGWQQGAAMLGNPDTVVETSDLPGFSAPTVEGHGGSISSFSMGTKTIALISGRVHLYEGRTPAEVVHPVRTVIAAGASRVVLTNAAGSIDPENGPGSIVMISDHINLTGASPLEGANPPAPYGSRFVDLTDLYAERLRAIVRFHLGPTPEGVYVGLRGPHFETPAEISMFATVGGALVGMSTVLEAIAARHLGAEVLGVSLVTNLAAGVSATALSHTETLDAGRDAAPFLAAFLGKVLPEL